MDELILLPRGVFLSLGVLAVSVISLLMFAWRQATRRASVYQEHLCEAIENLAGNEASSRTITRLESGATGDAAKWWVELSTKIRDRECDLQLLRRAARGDVIQVEPPGTASDVLGGIRTLQAEVRNLREGIGDRARRIAFYEGWHATISKEAGGESERDAECGLPDAKWGDLRAAMIRIRALWSRVNDLQSQLNAELAKPAADSVSREYNEFVTTLSDIVNEKFVFDRDPGDSHALQLLEQVQRLVNEEGIERTRADYEESRKRLEARIEQATTSRDSALDRVAALEKQLEEQKRSVHAAGFGPPYPSDLPRFLPVLLAHVIAILEGKADPRMMFTIPAIQHQDLVAKLVKLAWTVSKAENHEPGDTRVILAVARSSPK